ncbi:MAG TPA: GtrA family protein [Candidatus Saccharimonadia bacterium]
MPQTQTATDTVPEPRLWIMRLLSHRFTREAISWAIVGLTGVAVNQLALWVFVQIGLGLWLANILNTPVSTTWNFWWIEKQVYHSSRHHRLRRFAGVLAINTSLLLVQGPMLIFLIEVLHKHYLTANLLTLAPLWIVRMLLSRTLWFNTFTSAMAGAGTITDIPDTIDPDERRGPARLIEDDEVRGYLYRNHLRWKPRGHRRRFFYDVHGLVRIVSDVRLPELTVFQIQLHNKKRIERFVKRSQIKIARGRVGNTTPRRRVEAYRVNGKLFSYLEQCGNLGANFHVSHKHGGERVQIRVSPLLAGSPHVLYTNVVEAVLRFMLAQRGYMLLHSATMELDGRGVMLSARTDTGKTGTVLRMLAEHGDRIRFLSDDMTIVNAKGEAWCYPKPLTISSHTLRAVNRKALNRWQRVFLPVQSRIHSKSGRGFAFLLAKLNLPIMSINCLTQMIIPPPKYWVDELVPCRIARQTKVKHLFIIERGHQMSERPIGCYEAVDVMLANTEDAYGFPPFAILAPALTLGEINNLVLRTREREILNEFLRYIPVTNLVDPNFGWADRIPAALAKGALPSFLVQHQIDSEQLLARQAVQSAPELPALDGSHVPANGTVLRGVVVKIINAENGNQAEG